MKITVLSGSPKGEDSVTLQYVRYLQKSFPDHDYRVFHVAQQIRKLERDEAAFRGIMDRVAESAAVIWAFPLYYCLVCSQYKRFIELIFARGHEEAFQGKHALTLSTSVHFFDHTAHNYLHGICDDLAMNYFGGYAAKMYDLVRTRERERFLKYGGAFLEAAARRAPTSRTFSPLRPFNFVYVPEAPRRDLTGGDKKILMRRSAGRRQSR